MRARARERELGIFDHAGRQAGAERRRLHAGDRVGVGEDHLGGDAVGVHLLVALLGVERAAEPFLVVGLPVRDVVVVELHLLVAAGLPLGEELVERRVGTRASRYGRYSSHGSPAWQSAEMMV